MEMFPFHVLLHEDVLLQEEENFWQTHIIQVAEKKDPNFSGQMRALGILWTTDQMFGSCERRNGERIVPEMGGTEKSHIFNIRLFMFDNTIYEVIKTRRTILKLDKLHTNIIFFFLIYEILLLKFRNESIIIVNVESLS